MTQKSSYEYLPKNLENIYSQRYVHPSVHGSIIHNGQDMETTKVTFDRGLDKEAHIYYGILLSHKETWNVAICDNMGGPWEYYAKQNKSSEKTKNCMISLMWDMKLKLIDTDNSMAVTR